MTKWCILKVCVINAVCTKKTLSIGILTRLCKMGIFGVPKEPRIMQMDWKALGYEREYKDGRLRWVPQNVTENTKDQDPSS